LAIRGDVGINSLYPESGRSHLLSKDFDEPGRNN